MRLTAHKYLNDVCISYCNVSYDLWNFQQWKSKLLFGSFSYVVGWNGIFSPKISADQLLCTLEGRQQWCMLAKNKSKEKRLLFLTAMDHPTQHVHS